MPPLERDSSELSVLDSEVASCSSARCGCDSANAHKNGESISQKSGPRYWRSLEDYADTPEFREMMHREFPAGASELLDGGDRRHFLKIMGASMALAGVGLAGCRRWPEEEIRPYAHRPENRDPGVPVHYATSMEIAGISQGLLVTSYDGRPIKIEGNPDHPLNRGATDAIAQASVLNLYDPDRSRHVLHNGERSSWEEFDQWMIDRLSGRRGNGLAIFSEASNSPSVLRMHKRVAAAHPNAQFYEYEPINNDNEHHGSVIALGSPHRTHYHFANARVIVSLDCDFLLNHPAMVRYSRDYADTRRVRSTSDEISRLYVVEPGFTLTGANADERLAASSAEVTAFAVQLAAALVPGFSADSADTAIDQAFLNNVVEDLRENRGRCVVSVGRSQPAAVHAIVHAINEALGNVGQTVTYTAVEQQVAHVDSLRQLSSAMEGGQVDTLVIIGGNPAYNAPADLDFASRIQQLQESGGAVVHLSDYVDETSQLCQWHLNRAHYLEAWGDGRAHDGTISIAQPLIEPLFDGRSAIELLALVAGDDVRAGGDIVRRTFTELTGADDFDSPVGQWSRTLHRGVLTDTAWQPVQVRCNAQAISRAVAELPRSASQGQIEVLFVPDSRIFDGRFANNGWLQELPEVMTKLTWDNALMLNPATMRELGIERGDMVSVAVDGRTVDLPVIELPGHYHRSASIALGYGRRFSSRIAEGAGFDVYALRSSDAMTVASATITRAKGQYTLATTQEHHAIETRGGLGTQQRLPSLLREATIRQYRETPGYVNHQPNLHVLHRLSLWEEDHPFHSANDFEGAPHAWAMSIDLAACTGCSACVVACQAENNIPIVGKDQVTRHREMHWIRVDRYYRVDDVDRPDAEANPDAVGFMPVPCMHCENAPCEQVCPVAATVHDAEGLNVMIYNRCIGTRYCSNNCPYKVRRFNYFDYHRRDPLRETGAVHVQSDYWSKPQASADPLRQLQFNPEVTVRSRGVMEKCTYCTQRISIARVNARNKWRQMSEEEKRESAPIMIEDGAITPACAQACPTEAIVFGDLLDPNSRVSQLHKNERTYEMLEELNVKPRTRYMGNLRNPKNQTV